MATQSLKITWNKVGIAASVYSLSVMILSTLVYTGVAGIYFFAPAMAAKALFTSIIMVTSAAVPMTAAILVLMAAAVTFYKFFRSTKGHGAAHHVTSVLKSPPPTQLAQPNLALNVLQPKERFTASQSAETVQTEQEVEVLEVEKTGSERSDVSVADDVSVDNVTTKSASALSHDDELELSSKNDASLSGASQHGEAPIEVIKAMTTEIANNAVDTGEQNKIEKARTAEEKIAVEQIRKAIKGHKISKEQELAKMKKLIQAKKTAELERVIEQERQTKENQKMVAKSNELTRALVQEKLAEEKRIADEEKKEIITELTEQSSSIATEKLMEERITALEEQKLAKKKEAAEQNLIDELEPPKNLKRASDVLDYLTKELARLLPVFDVKDTDREAKLTKAIQKLFKHIDKAVQDQLDFTHPTYKLYHLHDVISGFAKDAHTNIAQGLLLDASSYSDKAGTINMDKLRQAIIKSTKLMYVINAEQKTLNFAQILQEAYPMPLDTEVLSQTLVPSFKAINSSSAGGDFSYDDIDHLIGFVCNNPFVRFIDVEGYCTDDYDKVWEQYDLLSTLEEYHKLWGEQYSSLQTPLDKFRLSFNKCIDRAIRTYSQQCANTNDDDQVSVGSASQYLQIHSMFPMAYLALVATNKAGHDFRKEILEKVKATLVQGEGVASDLDVTKVKDIILGTLKARIEALSALEEFKDDYPELFQEKGEQSEQAESYTFPDDIRDECAEALNAIDEYRKQAAQPKKKMTYTSRA